MEQSLSRLGLNELEQNDFISYWLPKLQANEESFVHFAAEQYTDRARLTVSPQPDSVLRVQMLMTGWTAATAGSFPLCQSNSCKALHAKASRWWSGVEPT